MQYFTLVVHKFTVFHKKVCLVDICIQPLPLHCKVLFRVVCTVMHVTGGMTTANSKEEVVEGSFFSTLFEQNPVHAGEFMTLRRA